MPPSAEEANGILLDAAAVITECLPYATADGEQQFQAALANANSPETSWAELKTMLPGRDTPLDLLDTMSAEWLLSHQWWLLRILERHSNTYLVQSAALRAIKKLGAEWVLEHALTLVLERMTDVNQVNGAWASNAHAVRTAALQVLAILPASRLLTKFDAIMAAMLHDEESCVRAAAIDVFSALGSSQVHDAWNEYIGRKCIVERMPAVLSRLVDTGAGVRLAALQLLDKLPSSILQTHASTIRQHVRSDDWDADEEQDSSGDAAHSAQLKQQRSAARRAVLGRLHDWPLFDWLDSDMLTMVALATRDSLCTLAILAGSSRRLHSIITTLLAELKEPLHILKRSPVIAQHFPNLRTSSGVNFAAETFSSEELSSLVRAFPCVPSMKGLTFREVEFREAALPTLLAGIVGDDNMARRLPYLRLLDCSIADGGLVALAHSLVHLRGLTHLDLTMSSFSLEGGGEGQSEARHQFICAWRRTNLERWKATGCTPTESWCKVCDGTYVFDGSDLSFSCSYSSQCVAEGLQILDPDRFGGICLGLGRSVSDWLANAEPPEDEEW